MWRVVFLSLLAVVPSSSNFALPSYDFGNGAEKGSSATYQLNSSVGANGGNLSSSSYKLPAGIRSSTTVAVPPAASFSNPDSSYDRLKIIIQTNGAPSDTKYAIAISTDGFTTTKYVQSDQTVGSSFSVANYQAYAAWGGAGGCWILGLTENTAYQVKVAALRGAATGSNFGPAASASTSLPSVTFGLSTSLTSTPPFAVGFGSLSAGSVTTGDATVTTTITTNAKNGGQIVVRGQNNGLRSSTTGYTIASASANLDSANGGYGAQVAGTSQTSGGPVVAQSPYNNSGNTVGGISTAWQPLASFAAPVTGGNVNFTLKARGDPTAPPATNYSDLLTLSISLLF